MYLWLTVFMLTKRNLRVMEVLVGFAHAWDAKHKVRKDPCNIDRVCWREPQQRLQIKRIQFAYQELLSQVVKEQRDNTSVINASRATQCSPPSKVDQALRISYHGQDKNDGDVALEALRRIPLKLGPGFRCELLHRPLHLALECWDLCQPLP